MRRIVISGLSVLVLGNVLSGCFYRENRREERREERQEYRDRAGHAYRHARWHDQDVWQREDGRWYARHGSEWVVVPEVVIQ